MTNVPEQASSGGLKRSERVVALSPVEKETCMAFHATIVDFYSGDEPPHIAKPPVYDLLYGMGPKAIMEESVATTASCKPFLRWHHLPANNMTWCKRLISKIYEDADVSPPLNINEDWTKREHRGPTAHSRFIRPTSREIPSLLSSEGRSEGTSNMMLFMPFITLEAVWRVRQNYYPKDSHSPQLESSATHGQGTDTPDTIPTLAYPDLHIRRTLDQYFYTGLEDTALRDADQVIYRVQRRLSMNQEPKIKIIVVDQLWLWILNEEWIVSSFPQSVDHSITDQGDVLNSILHYLTSSKQGHISTVQELAALITSHCIDSFNYDLGSQARGRSSKIVDIYDEALQILSKKVNRLYGEVIHSTTRMNYISDEREQEETLVALTSRGFESNMLIELRDIRDELEIISLLQDHQIRVIRDMRTPIGRKNYNDIQMRYKRLQDEIDDQVVDVANLHKLAARISGDINQIVEIKQTTVLANEAKYSLTTSRQMAKESSKQGKIILLFTIVTIVFLPMSFLAAFFAIPIVEYPKSADGSSGLHLSWVCGYVLGLTAAIAGPLITLGYNFDRFEWWWRRAWGSLFPKTRKKRSQARSDSSSSGIELERSFDLPER